MGFDAIANDTSAVPAVAREIGKKKRVSAWIEFEIEAFFEFLFLVFSPEDRWF